jgi:hypothetical protein
VIGFACDVCEEAAGEGSGDWETADKAEPQVSGEVVRRSNRVRPQLYWYGRHAAYGFGMVDEGKDKEWGAYILQS